MNGIVPRADSRVRQYSLRQVSLDSHGGSLLDDWMRLESQDRFNSPLHDPAWLRGYFYDEVDKITTYLAYEAGSVCGAASFLLKDWPVTLHLGEVAIAQLALRRLRCLGGALNLPEDRSLYDVLFTDLANSLTSHGALYFTQIPVESFLWKYLTESQLVREHFLTYIPEDATLHPRLRLRGTFEDYMRKFSKTHRHTLRRKVSRFKEEAPGEVRLVRYTQPLEVDQFLDAAVEVSRKTYQWNLHQRGLRATERLRRRLHFAAEHGWFRSYLLFCGEVPYAFLSGYQWKKRYYTDEIGFDPALSKRSPGTVLQVMAIEDLFSYDTPDLIDFGSYDKYKEEFSNDNYTDCSIFLFRRGVYSRLIMAGDYSCRLATNILGRALRRLKLKSTLKRIIRDRSIKSE